MCCDRHLWIHKHIYIYICVCVCARVCVYFNDELAMAKFIYLLKKTKGITIYLDGLNYEF